MHLLIIPNEHVGSIKTLNGSHAGIVKKMLKLGEKLYSEMESKGSFATTHRTATYPVMGFHIPPFTSVAHLHLHVLGGKFKNPFRRLKYLPNMNTPWWIRGEDLLKRLQGTL